jgi:hypothetical protein
MRRAHLPRLLLVAVLAQDFADLAERLTRLLSPLVHLALVTIHLLLLEYRLQPLADQFLELEHTLKAQ